METDLYTPIADRPIQNQGRTNYYKVKMPLSMILNQRRAMMLLADSFCECGGSKQDGSCYKQWLDLLVAPRQLIKLGFTPQRTGLLPDHFKKKNELHLAQTFSTFG